MQTYIHYIATDLLDRFGSDMSRVAVVFPNKRASLFLNNELARQSSERAMEAIWSPSYVTISELFRQHSDLKVADQILLVCRLYDVYCRVTGITTETLDHFYGWGVLLLADFDDIDKNMADVDKLFEVVKDLHELDDVTYLDAGQREALRRFFSNFTDNHQSHIQEKFIRLWSKLHEIYTTFREELRNDLLAYEGMLYRDVIEQKDFALDYDSYCFVAFNMLQKVEQELFMRLKQAEPKAGSQNPRALFYWDYDTYYLTPQHEAGHFISEYLSKFPDALEHIDHSNFGSSGEDSSVPASERETSITYLNAPTEHIQARYVHDWLLENDRYKAGARTAIVMCNESLLQTIIRSLPEEVDKVNITTGYPLAQSPIVSFVQQLIELQRNGRILGTDKYRIRYVNSVLCHPYATFVSALSSNVYNNLRLRKQFYPSRKELSTDENLSLLFKDIDTISLIDRDNLSLNAKMALWLQDIIRVVSHAEGLDALAKESLFRTYQVLQRLFTLIADGTLTVDITTFCRLLMQIVNQTTVPYHGEPIEGIQIMGVLETRCLDFDHLLILSCNEGNMPKAVNDSSFIPHSVRRAYGLTTVEHKVGIYSYYFHRLLQRCKDVSISYNSSTEGTNTGEMSRFMLQLMVEGSEQGINVSRKTLQTGQETNTYAPKSIVKDELVLKRLKNLVSNGHSTSPSSLGKYLRCPILYYYIYVAGLTESHDEEPGEMDNAAFGTLFHTAAQYAYERLTKGRPEVSADMLEKAANNPKFIKDCIDDAFKSEVFHSDKDAKAYIPEYTGLQVINHQVISRLLKDLLLFDKKSAPISVVGLEKKVYTDIEVNVDGTARLIKVGGSIDRLDIVRDGSGGYQVRVIDYKTGSHAMESFASIDEIFNPKNINKHCDYFLQAMLYSYVVRHSKDANPSDYPVKPDLLFVQKARTKDYSPTLCIDNVPIKDVQYYEQQFLDGLSRLITEIQDPTVPFTPCKNVKNCETCRFRQLCGM